MQLILYSWLYQSTFLLHFVTFAVIHLNENHCFTAYLLQPKTGSHASLSVQTVGDLKLLVQTKEEVVFPETPEFSLIFSKLLGFHFCIKSLCSLYKSNCEVSFTPNL